MARVKSSMQRQEQARQEQERREQERREQERREQERREQERREQERREQERREQERREQERREQERRAQLAAAESEKSQHENTKNQKQSKYNANSEKIRRLKAVKSNLETQKGIADQHCKGIKNYGENADNFKDWYGNMYTKTLGCISGEIVLQYKDYVRRVDEVLDAVCNEITRLENENMQLHGDILHLASLINSLINKIRTLTN